MHPIQDSFVIVNEFVWLSYCEAISVHPEVKSVLMAIHCSIIHPCVILYH